MTTTLSSSIAAAIAVAKSTLNDGGLLVTVQHYPYASQNQYGEASWGDATSRKALVEFTNELVQLPNRGEVIGRLSVTFLEHVSVTTRDKIVLPDGRTTPILRVDEGVLNSAFEAFVTRVVME